MIRVGIGGWTFAPWRGTFYPTGLKQAEELTYASRHLTSIEINGTFYRAQSAASFKKWHQETPEDFVFAVKGHRAIANAKKLAETGEQIDWFFKGGIEELGEKLGPVLWQLPPFRAFDVADLGAFFKLLPRKLGSLTVRHVLEVSHKSFLAPDFIRLLREENIALAYLEKEGATGIADITADFVYARLQKTEEGHEAGYAPQILDLWAKRAKTWESGSAPDDLPRIEKKAAAKVKRDVFVYMISGAKVRAPLAAMALIERLSD
jgi:uncharacterized protein YecE (DUF72 family)